MPFSYMYKKQDIVCLNSCIVGYAAAENDAGVEWRTIIETDRICEVINAHPDVDTYRLYSVYGKYSFECANYFIVEKLL